MLTEIEFCCLEHYPLALCVITLVWVHYGAKLVLPVETSFLQKDKGYLGILGKLWDGALKQKK